VILFCIIATRIFSRIKNYDIPCHFADKFDIYVFIADKRYFCHVYLFQRLSILKAIIIVPDKGYVALKWIVHFGSK
jgi:hypothetical protein